MTEKNGCTPEELAEKLKTFGADIGGWGKLEENMIPPVSIGKQRDLLVQLRDVLQKAVDQDQEQVILLREKIARLQHGGGA